ncbi:MAG: HEPN domain-containing protein [Patescibacteria group bacterium]
MNPHDSKEPFEWLEKARHDCVAAVKLLEYGGHADTIAVHCHQAAEKALKAALLGMGIDYPFTHDLTLLVQLCIDQDDSFGVLRDAMVRLAPLYERERYPCYWRRGTLRRE